MVEHPDPHFPGLPPHRNRGGWLAHLLILTGLLLLIVVVTVFRQHSGHRMTPLSSVHGLLTGLSKQTLVFALCCGAAWLCSRARPSQWRLVWRGGGGPVWRGFLYSLAFRLAQVVLAAGLVVILKVCHLLDAQTLSKFRAHTENAISHQALANDPTFAWLAIALISGCAGLTEEIWRGGMLAGLAGTFPAMFAGQTGQRVAVVPVALLFGLAHLYMGWPAVVNAFLLGLALGAICVRHGTIWDAVFAHGFFDASSLVLTVWLSHHFPHLP